MLILVTMRIFIQSRHTIISIFRRTTINMSAGDCSGSPLYHQLALSVRRHRVSVPRTLRSVVGIIVARLSGDSGNICEAVVGEAHIDGCLVAARIVN